MFVARVRCLRRYATDGAKFTYFGMLVSYMTAITEFRNQCIHEQNALARQPPGLRLGWWDENNHFHGLLTSSPESTRCLLAGEGWPVEVDGTDNNRLPGGDFPDAIDVEDTHPPGEVRALIGDTMPNGNNLMMARPVGGSPTHSNTSLDGGDSTYLDKLMDDYRQKSNRKHIDLDRLQWATEQALSLDFKTECQREMVTKRRRVSFE